MGIVLLAVVLALLLSKNCVYLLEEPDNVPTYGETTRPRAWKTEHG